MSEGGCRSVKAAVPVTRDTEGAVLRCCTNRKSKAGGPGSAPTAFQVSGRPHVLEVVHVDDINDGRHHPSPVLQEEEGKGKSGHQIEQRTQPLMGGISKAGTVTARVPPPNAHRDPALPAGCHQVGRSPSALRDRGSQDVEGMAP